MPTTIKNQLKVSAILPFYNEQKTLAIVLTAFAKTKEVDQIILVNDGSRDRSAKIARNFLKEVKDAPFELINLTINHGKAAAVAKGLDRAKHELILLYDADMKEVDAARIDQLILDFKKSDDDLLIAPPADKPAVFNNRLLDLTSGERIFYKSAILPYRRFLDDRLGYGLEVMINYIHRHKQVRISKEYGPRGHLYKSKDHLNFWGQLGSFAKEGVQILGALVLVLWLDKFRK